jgi:hypothetical protein
VIIVGSPLDGTDNPSVALGTTLTDITGVVVYQYVFSAGHCLMDLTRLCYRFGFFYVLPLTAPTILTRPNSTVPPTKLVSTSDACEITFGDYNVSSLAVCNHAFTDHMVHTGREFGTHDCASAQRCDGHRPVPPHARHDVLAGDPG